MEENFLRIFSQTLEQKKTIPLLHPKHLTNPDTQQEYILSHRYRSSPNTFICTDLSQNNHHLKVIPCANYLEVQKAAKSLAAIQQKCQSNALLETFDSFQVLDECKWYYIIVTPSVESVTFLDLGIQAKESNQQIPRHFFISALLVLIDVIEDIYASSKLNCIHPNAVMICKHNIGPPLFEIKGQPFSLKISPLSKSLLLGLPTCTNHLNRSEKSDLWALSTTLYSLIGNCCIKDLPCLESLSLKEIQDLTPLSIDDPALEVIFRLLQNSSPSVFRHNYLKIWKGCFRLQTEVVEQATTEDLPVLHSVLLFKNYAMKSMVLKQLLVLGKNDHEVYVYLNENNIFWLFIEECLQIGWDDNRGLLEAFFKILKQKPKDYVFKEKLGELGILGLIYTTTRLDPQNEAFFDFIKGFMTENTLTVMQILFDTGVISKTLETVKKNPASKAFIKDTMSYYGPNSLRLIEEVHNMEVFPATHIIQALIDIPYYFKYEKLDQVFSLILLILKKKKYPRDEFIDVLKYTIQLVIELLTLPHLVQTNHLFCRCSSHTQQELFFLTKNPFLYYCIDCSEPLCSACFQFSIHQSHQYYNLLYLTPHFRCNCTEIHNLPKVDQSLFALPKYSRFIFLPTPGTMTYESYINKFQSKSEMTITTKENIVADWSENAPGIVIYYEVKINQAGKHENISIGFIGADVRYEGASGNIFIGDKVVCKAPRFGSYDTVGIGILRTQKAFFTYNGLLSSHFIDVEANQELKICIELHSEGCEIEIKLRSFFFQSFKPGLESLPKEAQKLLKELFEYLVTHTKKNNDGRLVESRQSLANLLKGVGKDKLAMKLS